jgi:hypothetical protein
MEYSSTEYDEYEYEAFIRHQLYSLKAKDAIEFIDRSIDNIKRFPSARQYVENFLKGLLEEVPNEKLKETIESTLKIIKICHT